MPIDYSTWLGWVHSLPGSENDPRYKSERIHEYEKNNRGGGHEDLLRWIARFRKFLLYIHDFLGFIHLVHFLF